MWYSWLLSEISIHDYFRLNNYLYVMFLSALKTLLRGARVISHVGREMFLGHLFLQDTRHVMFLKTWHCLNQI